MYNVDVTEVENKDKEKKLYDIRVIGVGGCGKNALNDMFYSKEASDEKNDEASYKVEEVEYIAVNTDSQDLDSCKVTKKVLIGEKETKRLGAGADPEKGRKAAEETRDELERVIDGARMVVITCGMGGGTGTGAAPVIAKIAKEKKILTLAVVTLPFNFEGRKKMDTALKGLEELKANVDCYIVVENERVRNSIQDKSVSVPLLYSKANEVLLNCLIGITDIALHPGFINVDFADIDKVLRGKGQVFVGIGMASGENRVEKVLNQALQSPLLNVNPREITDVLFQFDGLNAPLEEYEIITDRIQKTYEDVDVIPGMGNKDMGENIRLIVIASGKKDKSELSEEVEIKVEEKEEVVRPKTSGISRNYGGMSDDDALKPARKSTGQVKRERVSDFSKTEKTFNDEEMLTLNVPDYVKRPNQNR